MAVVIVICRSCREGGGLNAAIVDAVRRHGTGNAQRLELAVEAARAKHAECRGRTWCDCQHLTVVLPWEQAT